MKEYAYCHINSAMFDVIFKDKGLTLDRIRRFCEIADAGTIARAQETNRREQSSYSRDIAALERYFGFMLFVVDPGGTRSGKRLRGLTPQGQALRSLAVDFFHRLEEYRDFSVSPKSIDIGGGEAVLQWFAAAHVPALTNAMKQTTLNFRPFPDQDRLLADVRDGRIDFALVEESAVSTASAQFQAKAHPVAVFTFSLFVPESSPVPITRKAIHALMSRMPWVTLRDFSSTAQEATSELVRTGIPVHLAATLGSIQQLSGTLKGRDLLAFLPTASTAQMKALGFRPLDDDTLRKVRVQISMLYNEAQASFRPYIPDVAETIVRVLNQLDGGQLNQA